MKREPTMMFQTVSHSKYILAGLAMISLCLALTLVFHYYFRISIYSSNLYRSETCIVNSMNISQITFDCWIGNVVTVLQMPCVVIMVNTTSQSNIIFYRNIYEQTFVESNNYLGVCIAQCISCFYFLIVSLIYLIFIELYFYSSSMSTWSCLFDKSVV